MSAAGGNHVNCLCDHNPNLSSSTDAGGVSARYNAFAGLPAGVAAELFSESSHRTAGRSYAGKYRDSDEHGSDFGLQEGTENVAGGGGDFRDHPGRYPSLRSYEYSGPAAHGPRIGCSAD